MTDKKFDVTIGDIVQIRPDFKTKCFAACLLTVTEVKSFGVMGYITGVGKTFEESSAQYYLRPTWEDIEPTGGKVPWITSIGDTKE